MRAGQGRIIEWFERTLESQVTRISLSALIILSLLPPDTTRSLAPGIQPSQLSLAFLLIFSIEFSLRATVFVLHLTRRRATTGEIILLGLDLLAVISFIPMEGLVDLPYVRLFRLMRLSLLIGY